MAGETSRVEYEDSSDAGWVRLRQGGVDAGLRVATAAGGEVHLLSVLNEYEMEREGNVAEKLLAAEASTLWPLKVETKLLTSDRVAEAITSYAREESVDFIAMATHGRTGLAKTIIGSVAAEIQRTSDVPLLLVRPKMLK